VRCEEPVAEVFLAGAGGGETSLNVYDGFDGTRTFLFSDGSIGARWAPTARWRSRATDSPDPRFRVETVRRGWGWGWGAPAEWLALAAGSEVGVTSVAASGREVRGGSAAVCFGYRRPSRIRSRRAFSDQG